MEALFDLIFGNLAFIIVIIGGVISLLKRTNENQNNNRRNQNQNQNQNRKQTYTPIQTQNQKRYQPAKEKRAKPFLPQLDDLLGEITKHLGEQNQTEQPTVQQAEKKKPEFETVIISAEEVVQDIEKVEPYFEYVNKNIVAPKESVHQTININMKEMNRKKVVEGVIWGEILGPPRARKKHSYSYLKKDKP
ncbi:MAG TPA: hypothetical protein GXX18_06565 [Bacillales bacterium]|nr:hypothetical protein [Bacillales bacterium]